MASKSKQYRIIQMLTGVHRIHHIHFGYGYRLPFLRIAHFSRRGFQRIKHRDYHNCTLTGTY